MSGLFVRTVSALLGAILLIISAGPAAAQDSEIVDEIVAFVGNKIILRSEVDAMVASMMQQRPGLTDSERLWMDALDQMIDQHVMSEIARRDTNIVVQDDQVTQAMDRRINQMIRQVGSQARLEEIYGKSIVRIKADLREDFRDQMLAEQLQQQKLRDIRITPSEVRAFFKQFPTDSLPTIPTSVRLSHIVRYPEITERARQEAVEIISAIRDSIVLAGASFEEMARQFSDDPGSASGGGHIEDTNLGDLVPEFAAVASRLPIGEISDVFRTPFGYHILRVNERRGETVDFNHVLIRIDPGQVEPGTAIEFLTVVRDSIVTMRRPFELMAKRHSEEGQSSRIGGRVLDRRTGERDLVLASLDEYWRATIDTLDEGEISMPGQVELEDERMAYHIVKLHRRVPEHRVSLETDYERIEEFALQDKQQRILQEWLARLRDEVYVDLRGKAERISLARR